MPTLQSLTSKADHTATKRRAVEPVAVVSGDACMPACCAGYGGTRVADMTDRYYLSAVLLVCTAMTGTVRTAIATRLQQLGGSVYADISDPSKFPF